MKKIDNFLRAFSNLRDIYDYSEPYGNVELAGLVGLFEICFEQAWKAMKEYLLDQGFPESRTGSPRQILKTAFECGLIEDEQAWLDALADRNNVSHAYNKDVALGIIEAARSSHYEMFQKLACKFEDDAGMVGVAHKGTPEDAGYAAHRKAAASATTAAASGGENV